MHCILRHTSNGQPLSPTSLASPASPYSNALMRNLLSIAQNVVPLTGGLGQLEELEGALANVHIILHDRPISKPVPEEIKKMSYHTDLVLRALSIHGENWKEGKSCLQVKTQFMKLNEDKKKSDKQQKNDSTSTLKAMGFSTSLCQRALLLCNSDSNQSVNWLMDNGMKEMENEKKGLYPDLWGLEGVDFYPEKGH
jgi:hypothetical protein